MTKKITIACLLLGTSLITGTASAYSINDTTASRGGSSVNNTLNASYNDVIGDPVKFEVFGINITRNVGTDITFDLFTNVSPGAVNSYNYYLADFAIDANRDGNFEYGVVLQDHDSWTGLPGLNSSAGSHDIGLYAVTSWKISSDFYEEAPASSGGVVYGEKYSLASGMPDLDPIVAVDGYSSFSSLSVAISNPGGDGTTHKYIYSFTIAESSLSGIGALDPIIFWGGATCANDAISNAPVPEPATMFLLGSGLVGIWGARRRSKRRA